MTLLSGKPAIIVLGTRSIELAAILREAIGGEIWAPSDSTDGADQAYDSLADALRRLFGNGRPIVGLCATGILVRTLAPLLADKHGEPPVIAIAEDGSAVVPILGGHHGANELARAIAKVLGVGPAITTAGDLAFGTALDAPPAGWRLRHREHARRAMARLLSGEKARLVVEDGPVPDWLGQVPSSPSGTVAIVVSIRQDAIGDLVYAPAMVALGLGCERLADTGDVSRLATNALAEANVAPEAIAGVVSIDLKTAEPALHALARELDVAARFFDAARLEHETPRLANPSDIVFRETGCHGVAEGAALAAVGNDGRLILPKLVGRRATVALAKAHAIIDPSAIGRRRGRLSILGIGPGNALARTREVDDAIATATEIVGYKLYLELLGHLVDGKRCHGLELGEETERARLALDLAAEGLDVALISSGDAGIYAMASLVFELIDLQGRQDWARIEIRSLPGVSAMQTAAARAGAPLGHDFCAISLSDLLTPWAIISGRLEDAAKGDFVVGLYNPVSLRRTAQLGLARDILLRHRPPATPVVIARNLGREGETMRLSTLEAMVGADIDMLTVLIVGSKTTRIIDRPDGGFWVYTPRGYAEKATHKLGAAG